MLTQKLTPEILAPGGSFEAVKAGIAAGASAVYVGLSRFSARAFAKNFTVDSLPSVCSYCHERGVKIYLAVNTLIHEADFVELRGLVSLPVDAFILQDLGAIGIFSEKNIHASTQMTIHNTDGLDFAKSVGFSRAVLSRELSREEIALLASHALQIGIETEVFVYGALCMSVSGQCFMSAFFDKGKRSANAGSCAGACRLPFSQGRFNPSDRALSLKDQCLSEYVSELSAMGITSLKIEGRMKGSDYTSKAVKAIVSSAKKSHGMTDGYYTGKINDCFGKRDSQT
ncbi:MAG: U32 family peptidase [Ruminococcus sp.]|nr:U32 family peptidase [Ruminococcus sp.]